jgi:hypothetical protein
MWKMRLSGFCWANEINYSPSMKISHKKTARAQCRSGFLFNLFI